MRKRILAGLLVLIIVLTLAACGKNPALTETPAPVPAAETPVSASEPENQEAVPDISSEPSPADPSGDIVILYTSDIHCGINQGFGYAGLQAIREYHLSQGDAVFLVDNGDNIQGEPVGTMSMGKLPLDLMNAMGYDVAIPGNHEFDYGMEQFLSLAESAEFPYVSCNFNREGERVFDSYVILEAGETKVAFVGVTTPKTLTSSTPRYFQDENGDFVYGFLQDMSGEKLYDAVQQAVDGARADGADYVIVLGHMGNIAESSPYTYADVISHITGIDAFLDGHSHDTEQVEMKDREGHSVLRSACGTKLANIGWCRIAADGKVTAGLYTWNNSVSLPTMLGLKNDMSLAVDRALATLNEELGTVVAKTSVDLTICDPEPDANGNPVRMVRRAETNLGDLCADACRFQSGADIALVSGGGIRVNIPAGDITLNDILRVNPFGNEMCVLELTGEQILDALEWGAHSVPAEHGGFLQVSGLSYEVHSYIESSCTEDENRCFTGVAGERRVKNVLIGGEPIDPEGVYSVGGFDYLLLNQGDGYSMFKGAKILQDRVKLDNQVLIDYITENLGGVIGEEYEDPFGQGRITIIEEKPLVSEANAGNVAQLLADLVNACESPTELDAQKIKADLDAIAAVDPQDLPMAESIAEYWQVLYLDPDYHLYLYQGDELAEDLRNAGIKDSPDHAIVVLGFALQNGEMQPELMGRCDAAAAMARTFPSAILVCSGGATGENNPDRHTEAGLMKEYLTDHCGIKAERIYTDEKATTTGENAVNTFEILRENNVRSITIVTSSYHQRRGQILYAVMAEIFRQRYGYSVDLAENYCYDIESSSPIQTFDGRIAAMQIADFLSLPEDAMKVLPSMGFPGGGPQEEQSRSGDS